MKTFLNNKLDIFSLRNSFVLYYLLMFVVAPFTVYFLVPSEFRWVNSGAPPQTFLYLALGLIFFIFGYRFINASSGIFGKIKEFSGIGKLWKFERVGVVLAIIFLLNVLVKIIFVTSHAYIYPLIPKTFAASPFYSLLGALSWTGFICVAIGFSVYFYFLKNKAANYKIWGFVAWTLFIFEFFYGFFSGSVFRAVAPIVVYLIVKNYIFRPSLRRVFLAALLVLFLIMPFLNLYKQQAGLFNTYLTKENQIEKVKDSTSFRMRQIFALPILVKAGVIPLKIKYFILNSGLGRINQLEIVSAVFLKTESFLYGKPFLDFFVSMGPPKFIWKNKPAISASGNDFARQYGIAGENDNITSVGPTVVGNFYMNFGVVGIVAGMFLLGGLWRFIYDFLVGRGGASLSGAVIYSFVWIQFMEGMENSIAPIYAGLTKLVIFLYVIHLSLTIPFKKQN